MDTLKEAQRRVESLADFPQDDTTIIAYAAVAQAETLVGIMDLLQATLDSLSFIRDSQARYERELLAALRAQPTTLERIADGIAALNETFQNRP